MNIMNRKTNVPLKIKDIMSSNIQSCCISTSLEEITSMMLSCNSSEMIVVGDSSQPVGIVNERDVILACNQNNKQPDELDALSVIENKDLYLCLDDDGIDIALAIMNDRKVSQLPVANCQGLLVGMLSIKDVVCCLGKDVLLNQPSYDASMSALRAVAS